MPAARGQIAKRNQKLATLLSPSKHTALLSRQRHHYDKTQLRHPQVSRIVPVNQTGRCCLSWSPKYPTSANTSSYSVRRNLNLYTGHNQPARPSVSSARALEARRSRLNYPSKQPLTHGTALKKKKKVLYGAKKYQLTPPTLRQNTIRLHRQNKNVHTTIRNRRTNKQTNTTKQNKSHRQTKKRRFGFTIQIPPPNRPVHSTKS